MPPPFQSGSNFARDPSPVSLDVLALLLKREGEIFGAEPEPTPLSGNLASDSGIPKIGGSPAGFIALVVTLSAIVVICCIGIFFLLRANKPDEFERHARRALSGPREASIYEMPLGPAGARAKFKSFFGFGKPKNTWVRVDSRDDWHPSEEIRPGHGQARELTDHDVQMVANNAERHPHIIRPPVHRSSTSDSIELSVPDYADLGVINSMPHVSYTDPFSISPMSSTEEIQGPISTRSGEGGRFSVQSSPGDGDDVSVRSMRKLEGGTKFKEVIST